MSAIGASFPGESGDMKMHSSQLADPIHRTHGSAAYLLSTMKIWATNDAGYILKVV